MRTCGQNEKENVRLSTQTLVRVQCVKNLTVCLQDSSWYVEIECSRNKNIGNELPTF